MKTILAFDCWLPGFTYVKDIVSRDPSINLIFVHTSSMQTGAPAREYQDFKVKYPALDWVRDFSDFDYDFKTLFDRIKPDALLVTSLHHIEDRTALIYAKHRKVPSYFIPHGIFFLRDAPPVTDTPTGFVAKLRRLFFKLPRVAYYTNFFWRFHFAFRREGVVSADLRTAIATYRALIGNYFYWQWKPAAATQDYYARAIDTLIIYDASLTDHYHKNYGRIVDGSRFVTSGTLDVAKLTSHLQSNPDLAPSSQRIAYFVSSPYTEYFEEPLASIYKDMVQKLRDLVLAAGYDSLIYRPHPGEPDEFTQFMCADLNIEIDTAGGVGGLITSELICGTSSSLLYIAVILQKKILILDSHRIPVDLPYYEPLLSYPAVQFNADLDRDEKALADLRVQTGRTGKPDISELKDPVTDFINLVYGRYPSHEPADDGGPHQGNIR
ncbi:hypothetical protein [Devosia sediminis]|uniref:Uncharacterized protein n=1 Tax=Devosia sediminis TaxID=2798801 RepID=A0A934IYH7_9HYPH|nr:hypothetical protein [Devosia sediminis]MBJ3785068.1 hypothetical protein [Devosia sediminis]